MAQYTDHYNLIKPSGPENALISEINANMDILDAAIYDASQHGGITVGPVEPEEDLAWIDTDEEGADFCYVGDEEPPNDGSVAVWVDTSEDERVSTIEVGDTAPTDDSVQIWVDTSEGANLADYIIEQGTSGIWTYRKWNSGIAECWGIKHHTNVACTTAWGNIYQSGPFSNTQFPFEFISAPTLTVHLSAMSTADYSCWVLVNGTNVTSKTQTGTLIIARGSSATVPNVYVNFYVIGRWK